ncbi:DUF4160 domain-containing protein [Candidatus Neptunochlamydia vexilliferae]|uniref:DUF4160 domain-containing protein n=1 Tax=Candidatus Neptunichlamydia vexilliferae TaxID=1651774 RepID=A0ABS0AYS8_9BACT|nr:DUF4160 domain-containing protein [Candidatus Neptunochlamydia vexilliferae]MBF5059130.1 hypothetical protein [Candidatus Neptunochlamydia vexilliferae]
MSNVVSEFYGMTILMLLDPSDKTPHIQVLYEGEISKFNISSDEMYEGSLGEIGQDIIKEWLPKHREELTHNWKLLLENKKPEPIAPFVE